ncbi:MAG: hypothetical protein GY913_28225 [Proteobacteria bacterium]|nr:hypothetical protein [Pseudomonadota bacterium]MCP4920799.1 hypothetical protein [Pseudomonadota bacterium]
MFEQLGLNWRMLGAGGGPLVRKAETAVALSEKVLLEVEEGTRKVLRVHEGPCWLAGYREIESEGRIERTSAHYLAHTPSRVAEVDVAGAGRAVQEALVRGLRRQVSREIEPFQDFLDAETGIIPLHDYAATDVELVILVVNADCDLVDAAEAAGHEQRGKHALLVFSRFDGFGGGGRRTSYDELSRFLPVKFASLFSDRFVPDSAPAVLIGVEAFDFPKVLGETSLGRQVAWSKVPGQDVVVATWSEGEDIQSDVFAAELIGAVMTDEHSWGDLFFDGAAAGPEPDGGHVPSGAYAARDPAAERLGR